MIERNTTHYQECRQAWELVNHPAYDRYLKPILEERAQRQNSRPIRSLDELFEKVSQEAESCFAQQLLRRIHHQAKSFTQFQSLPPLDIE